MFSYRGSQSMLFIVFGLCGALASATITTTTTTTTPASTSTTTTTTPASTSTTSGGFLPSTTTTTTTPASTSTTTTTSGPSLVATGFVKYYDSNTSFDVDGWVWFEQILSDSEVPGQSLTFNLSGVPGQSLTWNLSGVDPKCKTGSGNQCGIHIHENTSCTGGAEGHYWNETLVNSDPWTVVQYSTINGTSHEKDGVRVISGLEMEDIVGHAVIVHDSVAPGRRIACALITESPAPAPAPKTPDGFNWWILVVAVVVVLGIGGAVVGGYFYFKDQEDKSSV